jgi:putative inorganic carbon (HCO3(-)) transporter
MLKRLHKLLVDWQWVILVLVSPFLLFPSPRRNLVLIIIPFLWLISFVQKRKQAITPFNIPILLLMLMVLISLWATYDIEVSLPKITGMILGISFFFGLYFLTISKKSIQIPLIIYLLASSGLALISLLGLRQFQKIRFLQPLVQRLPQTLIILPGAEGGFHPNEVAGSLLWVLPLLLSIFLLLLLRFKHRKQISLLVYLLVSLIVFVLLLFSGVVFVLAQSRTAYLALFLAVLLLFVFFLPRRFRISFTIVLTILLLLSGWYTWQSGFIQNLYEETTIGGTTASVTSLNGRIEIWSRAIYGIQDFPFTGMGMNTFRKIMPILYPSFTISPEFDIGHAHNEFLQVALDLGIPGLIAFLSIYMLCFGILLQTWQRAGSRRLLSQQQGLSAFLHSRAGVRAIVLGIGSSLLAHALYGLTDAVALGAKPGILFWMLLGLAAGLHHLVCAKPASNSTSDSLKPNPHIMPFG